MLRHCCDIVATALRLRPCCELGSVRFGSVRFGSDRFGSDWIGSVRIASVRIGSGRFGSVGSVRLGSVRIGLVRIGFCSVRIGSVRIRSFRFCSVRFSWCRFTRQRLTLMVAGATHWSREVWTVLDLESPESFCSARSACRHFQRCLQLSGKVGVRGSRFHHQVFKKCIWRR